MHVAFVHPDLGLGGAERLIIDAALSLKAFNHTSTIYSAFLDPARCFPEVSPTSPTLSVRILTSPFPRTILGRFHAALAALRCASLALYICLTSRPTVAVVDIVSLPVLVFSLFRVPVIFYCHFPDPSLEETLRRAPHSVLRKLYRAFIDFAELTALGTASLIVCNSKFTQGVFASIYPSLPQPRVVYPSVNLSSSDHPSPTEKPTPSVQTILSLNRFERKKNIPLVLSSFALARKHLAQESACPRIRLIVAGGYDKRLEENVSHFAELEALATELGIQADVSLRRNVSDSERRALLAEALAVVYSPAREHFGIVPLEAMAAGTAVVAVDEGGPTESVVDGVTGRLCRPRVEDFAKAMVELVREPDVAAEMGLRGRERVLKVFSRDAMGVKLDEALREACR